MAKSNSGRGTKGEAIRQILTENPKTATKAIVASLAEKGVNVSKNHVYYIKSRMRQKKRRQKREKAAETTRTTAMPNPAQAVAKVKSLARELGGLKNLKQLVDVLAE